METEQDPYGYPGTTVLRNLLGLKCQEDLDVYENPRPTGVGANNLKKGGRTEGDVKSDWLVVEEKSV